MRIRLRSLMALMLALMLVAAACGSDDESASTDETTTTTAAPADDGTSDDTTDDTTAPDDDGSDEPASTEPIMIGALTPLTERFTPWGLQTRDGMKLAVDEINAAGGVSGRMLELVELDTQANAEEAVIAFERAIEDGVVAAGGVISSDVGLATARVAEESEVPLFMVKAGADAILTRDSRYTFRTCLPSAPMVASPIAQYALSEGVTRIGAIIADYGWGRAIEAAMMETFDAAGGLEYQIEVAPVPEQEFTTYLRSLEGFEPELIVATGHPPGAGPITVQSSSVGFDVPVTGAYTPWALVAGGAGETAIGRYADFKCADFDSPEYQELAVRFLAATDQVFMEDDAIAGYAIVTMVARAVEAVGDDPKAIAEWLHTQRFEDLPGFAYPLVWTEWGELAEAAPLFYVLGEGPAPAGLNEAGTWYPELLSRTAAIEPYEPAN